MKRKFILTRQGLNDLREIAQHYRKNGTNDHIESWLAGLVEAIDALKDDHDRFPIAPERRRVGYDLRQKLFGSPAHRYRILFALTPDSIEVLRIWHGARRRARPDELTGDDSHE